jgi:hypothetical protein
MVRDAQPTRLVIQWSLNAASIKINKGGVHFKVSNWVMHSSRFPVQFDIEKVRDAHPTWLTQLLIAEP